MDKTLVCQDCGKEFIFTEGEQAFYKEKGFDNEPKSVGRLGPDTLTAWISSPTAVRTPESSSLKFNRHIKRAALQSERRPF